MAEKKITSEYDGLNLPYSAEAEQSVLGAILIDANNCLGKVMEILPNAEYFHIYNNRAIYTAMIDLFVASTPVDFITVLEQLKNNKTFDESSGKVYLMQLVDLVPSVSRVEEYARIVRDKYLVRSLIMASRDIIDDAVQNGSEDVSKLIDSAEQRIFDIRDSKETQGLERLKFVIFNTFNQLEELNSPDKDKYKGIPTGISALDNTITGLNRSDLILLAARPGMGKTSFALNIARHAAVVAHKRVAFFSLEMTKEQLASRLLSTEGMIEGKKMRTGELTDEDWVHLVEAADVLSKADIYLDESPGITVPEMKAKLRRLKGVDLVIIDYLQLMSGSRRIENRVQEISEITRNLKIMAKEFNVPLLTLSQLSRASEQRAEHKPQLSDLRDSGSIEQDADIVLFLYRDDYYTNGEGTEDGADRNSGECIIAKNRHGETKSIPLHWQGQFMRFTAQELLHEE